MAEEKQPAEPQLDEALIEEIDNTEVVSVVQRPGEFIEVDGGDTDPDVVISMLVKGLFSYVMDELCYDEDLDIDDDDEETPA